MPCCVSMNRDAAGEPVRSADMAGDRPLEIKVGREDGPQTLRVVGPGSGLKDLVVGGHQARWNISHAVGTSRSALVACTRSWARIPAVSAGTGTPTAAPAPGPLVASLDDFIRCHARCHV